MAMRVPCTILRGFPFSADGFTPEHAEAGNVVGIPSGLIDGLARAGYLRRTEGAKAMGQAVENKMIAATPENKDDEEVDLLRGEYAEITGKKPHHLWRAPRLREEINRIRGG